MQSREKERGREREADDAALKSKVNVYIEKSQNLHNLPTRGKAVTGCRTDRELDEETGRGTGCRRRR